MKIQVSMKVVFLFVGEEKYSTVVNGGDTVDSHYNEVLGTREICSL